jgi:hypothetical protein
MDSLPPKRFYFPTNYSPTKSLGREQKGMIGEFPTSFFEGSLAFGVDEFGRKRYQTDSFATSFSPVRFDPNFSPFSSPVDNGKRAPRIRASSLSNPQNGSVSAAFGPGIFSSVWEPLHSNDVQSSELASFPVFADRFAPAVEESENMNVLSTIGLLGLDEASEFQPFPRRNDARPRSISVSFPTAYLDEEDVYAAHFNRTVSSMTVMTESLLSKVASPKQLKSWQEMVRYFYLRRLRVFKAKMKAP